MPIRYEDRTMIELRDLAVTRGIPHARRLSKSSLIQKLRGSRVVSSLASGSKRSPSRVQRYERCVRGVKSYAKYYGINPYAVCYNTVYGSVDKSVKRSKSPVRKSLKKRRTRRRRV